MCPPARTPVSMLAVIGSVALALGACTRRDPLEPAATAQPVPGLADAAVTTTDGVKIVAQSRAWNGTRDILDDVTPVWVEIFNGSQEPLALKYENFRLVAIDGTKYAALPPFATDGTARLPVPYAQGAYPGFAGAPYYGAGPVVASPYPYTWYDPVGYDYGYYYDDYVTVTLPTPQMVMQALPEGALEPGSRAAGFLYFQRVDDEKGEVDLKISLVDASTNEPFGRATIPFRVDEFP